MHFTQANNSKKQQNNLSVVGLDKPQMSELVEQFFPDINARIIKNKPDKYMLLRMVYFGILALLLINIGLYFLPPHFLLLNVVFGLLIFSNSWFTYHKSYYYLDEDYVVSGGGGLINTWTSFLELHKTQAIEISQTIFQKRRGLANLIIHSASKSMKIPHIEKSLAVDISNVILYLVESQNKDWM